MTEHRLSLIPGGRDSSRTLFIICTMQTIMLLCFALSVWDALSMLQNIEYMLGRLKRQTPAPPVAFTGIVTLTPEKAPETYEKERSGDPQGG